MSENEQVKAQRKSLLENAEQQVSDVLKTLEDQDARIWAYLLGGVVALLVGLLIAYYYSQVIREKRKSTLERVVDSLRGGIGL
ncbi:MAG: hypothetical protein JXJ20_07840 [Anaerolineae bacterium]|jgi:hypothetical protein|nr:hypothetical protein [Anaerolineae bacterium]